MSGDADDQLRAAEERALTNELEMNLWRALNTDRRASERPYCAAVAAGQVLTKICLACVGTKSDDLGFALQLLAQMEHAIVAHTAATDPSVPPVRRH